MKIENFEGFLQESVPMFQAIFTQRHFGGFSGLVSMARTKGGATKRAAPSATQLSDLAKLLHARKAADGETKVPKESSAAPAAPAKEVAAAPAAPAKEVAAASAAPAKEVAAESAAPAKAEVPMAAKAKCAPRRMVGKTTPAPEPEPKPVISEEDLLISEGFHPGDLSFTLCWDNFEKLKDFLHLDDTEACCICLAMCGATKDGYKIFKNFDYPKYMFGNQGQFLRQNAKECDPAIVDQMLIGSGDKEGRVFVKKKEHTF